MLGDPLSEGERAFLDYAAEYGKMYATRSEYELRKELFLQRLNTVVQHNSRNSGSLTLEINKFADMTTDEWTMYKGYRPQTRDRVDFESDAEVQVPDSVDWF